MPERVSSEIPNQSPPFTDVDLLATDHALREAVLREVAPAPADLAELQSFARLCGSADALDEARLANEHPPVLRAFDPQGRRRDEVEFHPAYHALMSRSAAAGLAAAAWDAELAKSQSGPTLTSEPLTRHSARAARLYLAAQLEAGHCSSLSMTNASAAAIVEVPELFEAWYPRVAARSYDPRSVPAPSKAGVTLGLALTERQGGTDFRTNTTRAEPIGHFGAGEYRLTGHKWFVWRR